MGPQVHILPRKMMGRVRGTIGRRSKDTHEGDREFWTGLNEGIDPSSTPPLPPAVTPIIGDESRVRWLAENVVQVWPYEPVPKRGLESNSNSASLAIANRGSEQGEVSLPESPGVLDYPGSSLWRDVRFGSAP